MKYFGTSLVTQMFKNLPVIPGSGRSPGEGNDYLLQFSCLVKSMDREAWKLQSMKSVT